MKHGIDACLSKNANDINFDEKYHLRHSVTNSGLSGAWFLANLTACYSFVLCYSGWRCTQQCSVHGWYWERSRTSGAKRSMDDLFVEVMIS